MHVQIYILIMSSVPCASCMAWLAELQHLQLANSYAGRCLTVEPPCQHSLAVEQLSLAHECLVD